MYLFSQTKNKIMTKGEIIEAEEVITDEVVTKKLTIGKLSQKKLLIIFFLIYFLTIILGILYIKFRPGIRILNIVQKDFPQMKNDVGDIKTALNSLILTVNDQKQQLLHLPSGVPISLENMSRISSNYGYRTNSITGKREFHAAIDLTAKKGTPVFASGSGLIMIAKWVDGYGNQILIDHQNGYTSAYSHLDSIFVFEGQEVIQGEKIGTVGITGETTGPHLDFRKKFMGQNINPNSFNIP
jgi:murein DD-endopeptidase MepM/ murein hydrolase activator NlpD